VNILYLAHRIPYPPDKGDKIRSYHQLRFLSARHRIQLVCFADERRDLAHADVLREFCASVDVVYRSPRAARLLGLKGLLDGRAISVAAFDSGAIRRIASQRLRDADAVIAFSSVMAQYVPEADGTPRVIDFVDADSEKWRLYASRSRWPGSWVYAREAERLGRFEADSARAWDHSLFVSEREARVLRERAPGVPVSVIGMGVDLGVFTRPPRHAGNGAGNGAPRDAAAAGPSLVFTGMMDYFPNVDGVRFFAEEVLPIVRAAVPEARFTIVGRRPAPAVRRLAAQPGVEVTGAVPDVRPYLASADVAVVPLRVSRGLQSKMLEAMAMELPVVATTPAFEGLNAPQGVGIEVADDPRAFADRVIALLRDPARRSEAGRRARAYVEAHHRWADLGAALEALLEGLAARGPKPRRREAVS
jgi:sugar transferase (PEP-CTERM/EpsH1 system associated)